jgi:hypothetical protein
MPHEPTPEHMAATAITLTLVLCCHILMQEVVVVACITPSLGLRRRTTPMQEPVALAPVPRLVLCYRCCTNPLPIPSKFVLLKAASSAALLGFLHTGGFICSSPLTTMEHPLQHLQLPPGLHDVTESLPHGEGGKGKYQSQVWLMSV